MKLNDDVLEKVSGGRDYDRKEYEGAGVIIVGGEYFAKFSNTEKVAINKNVANSMVDCYRLNGQRLTDEQLRALIDQCK
ncbi:MAG: hypothetical protein K6A90_15005 [Lachnospiraceae bacterium]|nr:hypothetical protein [Lachnospiraceae bacterium]